ncbi:MAG: acyl-CoA dehydrogenase family protein [Sulfuricaulis sp.]|nr:acyl-CoA dehydrogenase family protein [Sulfuricaulis sp.]
MPNEMQVELPTALTATLAEMDTFIEREIKPLEQEDDNIRFFDHRRENSRTDWDKGGLPKREWLELLAEASRRADTAGYYRYALPKAYGGKDGSNLEMAVIREHLNAKGLGLHNDAASEHAIASSAKLLPAQLLIEFGTKAQQEQLLGPLLRDETALAMAITETLHGSDATHMETTARRDGSDWIIDGEKTWNSGVYVSDYDMVFARTSGKAGDAKGITAFLVPLKPKPAPGFVIEEYLWTFVMPTDHARVTLTQVRVPNDAIVGEEGEGLAIAQRFFNENRVRQAAASLGAAQYCINESIQYAKQRKPFGKPLASNQAIQFPLVELQTQCEMVRAFLYKTACLMDKYGAASQSDKVSMLNFWANRMCGEASDRAIQVHGGLGYSRHKPFEHIYRHHRRYRITEGTEEIQMRRVAGYMFGYMGGHKGD